MAALSLSMLPTFMEPDPLQLSQGLLQLLGTRLTVSGRHHIPPSLPILLVSNHRSALDAPVLMAGLKHSIAFACHPYMANVPVLNEIIDHFDAFPIGTPRQFFSQGYRRLRRRQIVGVFPEGAQPMVTVQSPRFMNPFQRGFAHLALRAPVEALPILPVALVSDEKGIESPVPLKLLGWFDPSEPLFQKGGGHPIVFYRSVELRIGKPIWVTSCDRERYQGHEGTHQAQLLAETCWQAVHDLLQR